MSMLSRHRLLGSDVRKPGLAIDPLFVDRWSPRAFTGDAVPDTVLLTAFEAARWAPSALNYQPWRFLYAHRDSARFPDFLGLMAEKNRQWAHKAGAIVYFLSDSLIVYGDKQAPAPTHAFDTGAAWANFAHQLHLLGYATRAVGGFDREAAPQILGVPERFHVHAGVAVGHPAHPDTLPETFRPKEMPTARKTLDQIAFEDVFPE